MGGVYKITFELDGRGVIYDPHEPIHLDGIIAWAGAFRYPPGPPPGRTGPVEELNLPLRQVEINGTRIYKASALSPEGDAIYIGRHFRKRFRIERAEFCTDAIINQSTGLYRRVNRRLEVVLCRKMVGWFDGTPKDIRKWLKALRAIGRKREMGYGRIVSFKIEPSEEDRTWQWEGMATRYVPHPAGLKLVRPRPPYWNATGRVKCLVPGEKIPDENPHD